MKRHNLIALIVSVLLGTVMPSPSANADDQQQTVAEISNDEYLELHKSLVPGKGLWRTVPWQTSLLKAQHIAARDKKPIFIWSMDGHPLGCT